MDDAYVRHQSLPILNVRGSHHEVGFNIGRTFSSFIHAYLERSSSLNHHFIHEFNTRKGKLIYEETLAAVGSHYPQYLRELEGIAQGANVPFFKLFLLHLDDIIRLADEPGAVVEEYGCSTILVNHGHQKIMGHTEDGPKEALGLCYIVSVHVTESIPNEIFTSFCYPGLLPGNAMGFNHHFAFTLNTISVRRVVSGRLPRSFIARALLSSDSFERIEHIIHGPRLGLADAVSVNIMSLKYELDDCMLYNIEAGPNPYGHESVMNIRKINYGEHLFHTNKLHRLELSEFDGVYMESSLTREDTQRRLLEPFTLDAVISIVGDESSPGANIFRNRFTENVCTLAVGIFNRSTKTWSIYVSNPKTSHPIVVLPIKPVA